MISFYTALALTAFAANSVLCRLAIGSEAIDPNSFTIIRLLSGIVMLWFLVMLTMRSSVHKSKGNWLAAFMLFIYAASFSFAYTLLDTGVGALVLFGTVQITVVVVSLYAGEHLRFTQWLGLLMAFSGLAYLLLPSNFDGEPISLLGFGLMVLSGGAWASYTLLGKQASQPLLDSAYNFVKTCPFILLLLSAFFFIPIHITFEGIALSIIAGAISSGLAYAIWYHALQGLSKLQAGVLQLSVPVIAALGGVLFIGEALTQTLMVSLVVVIAGIFAVLYVPKPRVVHAKRL